MPFAQHPFRIFARAFSGHRSLNDLADRSDMLFEVDVAFLRNQRRISCNSIRDSKSCTLADFVEIGSIKKKLHKDLQLSNGESILRPATMQQSTVCFSVQPLCSLCLCGGFCQGC